MSNPTRVYDYDEIFQFLVDFKTDHDGNAPSMRTIADNCKISSTSVVEYILDDLEKRGKIKRDPDTRQIRVVGGKWSYEPEQENFFDAVRNDPEMTPEQKSYWLN